MINKLKKCRDKVVNEMTCQGKQYYEQQLFFRHLWIAMRDGFTEENNTSSATFILERFLSILPLDTISKDAFITSIESVYKNRERTVKMNEEELNKRRLAELEKIKKPLEDFINKYCCPHDTLIITQGHIELLSGEIVIPLKLLD